MSYFSLRWATIIVAWWGTSSAACTNGETKPQSIPSTASSSNSKSALPIRVSVVASADRLAVLGSQKQGVPGGELFVQAAQLRERLWRLEHREVDALEAIELYRNAASIQWEGACQAALKLSLLKGELKGQPTDLHQALQTLPVESNKKCGKKAANALRVLDAYRPASVGENNSGAIASSKFQPAPEDVKLKQLGPTVLPSTPSFVSNKKSRITTIEHYPAPDSARVVVYMAEPTSFKTGFLDKQGDQDPRFYVDIKNAGYRGRRQIEVGGIVKRIRVGQQVDGTRVVLDLSSSAYRKVFYLPEPFRLVIDVSRNRPESPRVEPGRRQVRRVVLDPGHGGHDPGAIGQGGLREKDVTLDIAHRAAPLIARELGIATLLTRDADHFVALDERTARANAFRSDLFISIHCNASEDHSSRGIMTFVLDASPDALGNDIAARENAASPAASAELANVLGRTLDSQGVANSIHFAGLLQRATMASLTPDYPDTSDQGVKKAGFYVLAGAEMPAVLYEVSFLSNELEEARLDTGRYRQKMADAIVNAIRAYRDGL